jgi:hypothetical protein
MSEIVSMSSGPQGTASSSEAFEGAPSPEFGDGESENGASTESTEENVPRGTNGNGSDDGRPKSAAQQRQESRYERTKREKKEFHAQREAFKQQQAAFQAQQAQFARERAELEESKKPKRAYSLADLKQYREAWKKEAEQGVEGRADLVVKADAEIAAMEAEERASKMVVELPKRGTREHRQMWEQGEADIRQRDPEFMKPGSRLDTKLRQLFAGPDGNAYADHPQGIYAAYSEARRQVLEEDVKGLQTENAQLKKELQRLGGLTSISGGVPGRVGSGEINSTADFARLSSAEMRKHLLAASKKNKDTSGWL